MNVIRLTIIEWRPRLLLPFNGSMNGYEKEAKKQFSTIGKSQATTGVFSLLLLYTKGALTPTFLLCSWIECVHEKEVQTFRKQFFYEVATFIPK